MDKTKEIFECGLRRSLGDCYSCLVDWDDLVEKEAGDLARADSRQRKYVSPVSYRGVSIPFW